MSKPHAATPPDDPANPELEQELCRILGYDFEFLSDMSIQEDEVDQLKALITQREAQAYERGRRDELQSLLHEPQMHGDWQEVIEKRLEKGKPE